MTLVLLDADVLGRRRTGDETYVQNLLRALPGPAGDAGFRLAAATRHPELVPEGVEAIELAAGSQEIRMAWRMPRLLRRLQPSLAHFQHALPLRPGCPTVVTVHDLSFARSRAAMPLKDTLAFRLTVPRSARRAGRVIAVSERTKRDLIELYDVPAERIVVIPHGVDPAFAPNPNGRRAGGYLLFVGAIMRRKDPLVALEAAEAVNLPLVVVGPEKEPKLAAELRRRGADLRGYVEKDVLAGLYRDADALLLPSRYEGFGFPVLEAMACGTPVVAAAEPALREVAGDAAEFADPAGFPDAVRRALADRDRLAQAGLARAAAFSWDAAARATVDVYREVLGVKVSGVVISHGHAVDLEHSLPALAPQVDELVVIANVPGSTGGLPEHTRVIANDDALSFAANANVGFAATTGEYVLLANPDAVPEPDAVRLLVEFADAHPRCGVAGPQMLYPDGRWQPSRRRFPTVAGTVVRRTPLRLLFPPFETQTKHYYLDERPDEPVPTETMLGAFMLLRRTMLDELGGFDAGFRMYCEDIDLCYRAARAGWERWHVPAAVVRHEYAAEIDKRFWTVRNLWHLQGMVRFVRKHPERLRAVV